MDSNKPYHPTEEEDNNLFLNTGFRYSFASQRGFPFPWCARRSGKGWFVRDCPPPRIFRLSQCHHRSQHPGVEFKGWKAAKDFFQKRDVLLERARKLQHATKEGVERNFLSSANPTEKENVKEGSDCSNSNNKENDSNDIEKPGSEMILSNDTLQKQETQSRYAEAIDLWFRKAPCSVELRKKMTKDAEFQEFLKDKIKEYRLQLKAKNRLHQEQQIVQKLKKRKRTQPQKRTYEEMQTSEAILALARSKGGKLTEITPETNEKMIVRDKKMQHLDTLHKQHNTAAKYTREILPTPSSARKEGKEDIVGSVYVGRHGKFQRYGSNGGICDSRQHSNSEFLSPTSRNLLHAPSPTSKRSKTQNQQTKQKEQWHQFNSITIGEDPELDGMIESIIHEFTSDLSNDSCPRENNNQGGRGLKFDESAVLALREAAKEIVEHRILDFDEDGEEKDHLLTPSRSVDRKTSEGLIDSVSNSYEVDKCDSEDGPASTGSIKGQRHDEFEDDTSITHMIEQLIGECANGSGYQFDGCAVEVLKVAAKEMTSHEKGSASTLE